MSGSRTALIFSLVLLGTFLVVVTALAYGAIVEHWGADPRGTLIAAATVGISFFISMNLLLAWDERRRQRLGRKENGSAGNNADGPQ
jgi:hypothetical protein